MKSRNNAKIKYNSSGFTLVELLMTIAILAIVSTIAVQAIGIITRNVLTAETRSTLHTGTSAATDFVKMHLAYVSDIEIHQDYDAIKDHIVANKMYLYEKDGSIFYQDGSNTPVDISSFLQGDATIRFSKKTSPEPQNILSYRLNGTDRGMDYDLETSLELVNLKIIKGLNQGSAVSFTMASSFCALHKFWFYDASRGRMYDAIINQDTGLITLTVPTTIGNLNSALKQYVATGTVTATSFTLITGSSPAAYEATYTVTAEDGVTTKQYTIRVEIVNVPEVDGVTLESLLFPMIYDRAPLYSEFRGTYNWNSALYGTDNSEYKWFFDRYDEDGNFQFRTEIYPNHPTERYFPYIINPGAPGRRFSINGIEMQEGDKLVFAVLPIDQYMNEGEWTYSEGLELMGFTDDALWKTIVNDVYFYNLTAAEKTLFNQRRVNRGMPAYATSVHIDVNAYNDSTFDLKASVDQNMVRMEGTVHPQGSTFAIDLEPIFSNTYYYPVDDPRNWNKIRDSYSIEFDTVLYNERDAVTNINYITDGWGMLLNGNVISPNSTNKTFNRDRGYMFQFDPGAYGFVIRRNDNGHYVIPDLGASRLGVNESGSAATYRPTRITKDNFWTGASDDRTNPNWKINYTTKVTVQKQLDNNSIVVRVDTWHKADPSKRANTMWYGDFGQVQYGTHTFRGVLPTTSNINVSSDKSLSYQGFANGMGSWLGFRAWRNTGDRYKVEFYGLNVGTGFEMNIESAEFIVESLVTGAEASNKIKLTFDDEIRQDDTSRANLINMNSTLGRVIAITFDASNPRVAYLHMDKSFPQATINAVDGIDGNSMSRGSIRHARAGDVAIANGSNFTVKGKIINPTPLPEAWLSVQSLGGLNFFNSPNITLGTRINLASYANANQQFAFIPTQDEKFVINPRNKSLYLSKNSINNNINQQVLNVNDINQLWVFEHGSHDANGNYVGCIGASSTGNWIARSGTSLIQQAQANPQNSNDYRWRLQLR